MTTYRFKISREDDVLPFSNPFQYTFTVSREALMDAFGEPADTELGYATNQEYAAAKFAELCEEMLEQPWLRIGQVQVYVNDKRFK